ncbi:MAG: YwaF family protein [Oscillospiraceae bacterium]|nr:YwaF family protein [Oscillospiraceae bacterium]
MADFFIGVPNRLELFGPLHLWLSAVFIALYIALFVFRDKLTAFGHFKAVRITMASVLLANMAIHYISKIILGVWTFDTDLPLHLCFITNFFMIYILYTDNRRNLYRVIYFFTFIGPLPAMIWPDLRCSYDSYIFYQFIISHHVMLLISLYCLCVLKYETSVKSTMPAFFIGNLVIGSVMVFNMIFKTNYIMMNELPEQLYEIYPFLTLLPPLAWLELVGILAIFASCIPMLIFRHLDKKTAVSSQKTSDQPATMKA